MSRLISYQYIEKHTIPSPANLDFPLLNMLLTLKINKDAEKTQNWASVLWAWKHVYLISFRMILYLPCHMM